MGVLQDTREQARVQRIPQHTDDREDKEEEKIEDEKDVGEDGEPVCGVGELVEDDGKHARRHGYYEPGGREVGDDAAGAVEGGGGCVGRDWELSRRG